MSMPSSKARRRLAEMGLRYAGALPLIAVFPLFGVAKVFGVDIGIEYLLCAGSVSVCGTAIAYGTRIPRPFSVSGRDGLGN